MSELSNELVNELVAACVAFGRQVEPDWQTRIEKAQSAVNAYIAELEGLVDELIEAGAWGAELAINIGALSGDNQYKLAKKRYDKWDALVKDWKEREE